MKIHHCVTALVVGTVAACSSPSTDTEVGDSTRDIVASAPDAGASTGSDAGDAAAPEDEGSPEFISAVAPCKPSQHSSYGPCWGTLEAVMACLAYRNNLDETKQWRATIAACNRAGSTTDPTECCAAAASLWRRAQMCACEGYSWTQRRLICMAAVAGTYATRTAACVAQPGTAPFYDSFSGVNAVQ